MKLISNILINSIIILIAFNNSAQSLPKITYQDYGFTKPVKQLEELYYSFDSDSIERVEKVTYRFNESGKIESVENKSGSI